MKKLFLTTIPKPPEIVVNKFFFSVSFFLFLCSKGHLISKADLRAVYSPKKRTNEFGFFDMKSKKSTKTNSFFCFLGESAEPQSAFDFI